MILGAMPPGLRPIVQLIDDWFTCRKLGLVFEARVEDLDRRKPEPSRKRPFVDSLVAVAKARDAQATGRALRDARAAGTYDVSAAALLLAAGRLQQGA